MFLDYGSFVIEINFHFFSFACHQDNFVFNISAVIRHVNGFYQTILVDIVYTLLKYLGDIRNVYFIKLILFFYLCFVITQYILCLAL